VAGFCGVNQLPVQQRGTRNVIHVCMKDQFWEENDAHIGLPAIAAISVAVLALALVTCLSVKTHLKPGVETSMKSHSEIDTLVEEESQANSI
jgi:hypothetical protein